MPLKLLIDEMRKARRMVVLTGAGMSTESGLPDFRSSDGLWRKHRPETLATVEAMRERPLLFYEFYRYRLDLLAKAQPNAAHAALVELEKRGRIKRIITQNVDGFHSRAGSTDVAEIHGTLRHARCHDCGRQFSAKVLQKPVQSIDETPRCDCGGRIRPGVVLFGEPLPEKPFQRAVQAIEACDGMLIIGSSLQVYPAAALPEHAIKRGLRLWIINMAPTPFDHAAHVVVHAPAGEVLPQVAEALAHRL